MSFGVSKQFTIDRYLQKDYIEILKSKSYSRAWQVFIVTILERTQVIWCKIHFSQKIIRMAYTIWRQWHCHIYASKEFQNIT